ncbi:MarR family transcriptional regulator [Paeniglutamicibacter antarcticus]|uniref:MarR family transcriptional regulator n=1 Tax=Arthrobacter terrae TaxID=2935737 RepID=A0A931CNF9_9MICC|nr:MarR family transcriptional regulator [Arthrobacter terrae]MBG0738031.1 MarR family transcriptional regulator [Arthrobacter terrae]
MNAAELHRLARHVRTIALRATENTGPDRVNAGELSVLEDVARNPGATVSGITRRTGLARSLVSRISRAMADAGAISITADASDRRKVRVDLTPRTRAMILDRANKPILKAIAASTPKLSPDHQLALERHLSEAERLLRLGAES